MTPEEAIRREIETYSKTLSPKATSRWKHGYVDGLKQALKFIERSKRKQ